MKNAISEFAFDVEKVDISIFVLEKTKIRLRLINLANFSKIVAGDEVFKIK